MLAEASFKDFKLLRDVRLPLGRLNVLVGPNAVGKSTVLEGMHDLLRLVSVKPRKKDSHKTGRPGALFTGKRALELLIAKPDARELELEAVLTDGRRFGLRGTPASPGGPEADSFRLWFGDHVQRVELDLPWRDRADDEGFAQAVAAGSWPFEVVIGALPEPEIEAWLIAAWVPEEEPERKRHAALRGELHFDPCTKPEQLTSKREADRKDARRILEVLTTTGRGALERWADVPLERLEAHGGACGLARFVREVRERLVPIVESG
ncbi:AAA family ATPase [Sorangium sp. So ce119]|uniref:AAA family ATPase n=1 Tax=Sorangium sp. So ce119 TaxID=3133279 RepID=UPI003F640D5D